MIKAKKEIKFDGRLRRATYSDDEKDGMVVILEIRINKKNHEEMFYLDIGYNPDFMVPKKTDLKHYRVLRNQLVISRNVAEAVQAAKDIMYPCC